MSATNTEARIEKLIRRGIGPASIAKKIGRPGQTSRVCETACRMEVSWDAENMRWIPWGKEVVRLDRAALDKIEMAIGLAESSARDMKRRNGGGVRETGRIIFRDMNELRRTLDMPRGWFDGDYCDPFPEETEI